MVHTLNRVVGHTTDFGWSTSKYGLLLHFTGQMTDLAGHGYPAKYMSDNRGFTVLHIFYLHTMLTKACFTTFKQGHQDSETIMKAYLSLLLGDSTAM